MFGFPNLKFLSISCIILLNSLVFFPVVAQGATALYSYDANGNMIQGGDYVYDYNDDNRLTRISRLSDGSTVAEYFYDANGQRVKKVEGGVTTYYIGSHYETCTDGNISEDTTYFFANSERIARADPDDQVFYYHGDHLGSTSVVTDVAGVLNEKVSYLPYGAVKEHTGSGSTYLFTDQEFDPESGLYYYDARYYNPELTRFTQADAVIQDVYNPQNLNEYSYVMNNPVKYTDPSGHEYQTDYELYFSNNYWMKQNYNEQFLPKEVQLYQDPQESSFTALSNKNYQTNNDLITEYELRLLENHVTPDSKVGGLFWAGIGLSLFIAWLFDTSKSGAEGLWNHMESVNNDIRNEPANQYNPTGDEYWKQFYNEDFLPKNVDAQITNEKSPTIPSYHIYSENPAFKGVN